MIACLLMLAGAAGAVPDALPPEATADAPPRPATLSDFNGRIVDAIQIETTGRTRPEALRRQFSLDAGDVFDADVWQRDAQLILNLGFFRRVDTAGVAVEPGRVRLVVSVVETWAILPIFLLETGAMFTLMLGAYDATVMGELFELGGYYLRRDRFNLGRAWGVFPNLPLPNSRLEVQLVFDSRWLMLYPGDASLIAPDIAARYRPQKLPWKIPAAGYEILRRGFFVDFGRAFLADRLTLAGRYLYFRETTYTLANIQEIVDAQNRDRESPSIERANPRRQNLSLVALNAVVGSIDLVDAYLWRGHELHALVVSSSRVWGSSREFAWLYLRHRSFVNLVGGLDLGVRTTLARSTSRNVLDGFTLGGDILDPFVHNQITPGILTIRGFRATQFHGQNIWYANAEARQTLTNRIPLWILGEGAAQLAGFVDLGQAWDGATLPPRHRRDLALSAGGGLLFTLLDIRAAYLNWYVAQTLLPERETRLWAVLTRQML